MMGQIGRGSFDLGVVAGLLERGKAGSMLRGIMKKEGKLIRNMINFI